MWAKPICCLVFIMRLNEFNFFFCLMKIVNIENMMLFVEKESINQSINLYAYYYYYCQHGKVVTITQKTKKNRYDMNFIR